MEKFKKIADNLVSSLDFLKKEIDGQMKKLSPKEKNIMSKFNLELKEAVKRGDLNEINKIKLKYSGLL